MDLRLEQRKNMLRLVNYDSSDSDQEEEEGSSSCKSPSKKKLKFANWYAYSGVSSSLFDNADDDGEKAESSLEKLQHMGFSIEHVQNASAKCNSIDFDDILEYLIDEQKQQVLHELEAPPADQNEELTTTPSQKLQQMGFTIETVLKASEKCNSIDVNDILEYLMNGEHEGETTASQKLLQMGFCIETVQRASAKCSSNDVDDILECLLNGNNHNETSSENEMHSDDENSVLHSDDDPLMDKTHIQDWKYVKQCKRTGMPMDEEASSSDHPSVKLRWPKKEVDLWYSYIGGQRRLKQCNEPLFKISRRKMASPNSTKMKGFGIPHQFLGRPKPLPESMEGPPYFYFENVASAPKMEWETIKRHFNGVDPEIVDAMFFSACRRPRGYVHNLPLEDRKLALPTPPMTIFEALPFTTRFWPHWDTREKLNCISTGRATDSFCGLIRRFFKNGDKEIPIHEKHEILQGLRKWNLVWVGPGQVAPLEPHEIELFLGFDKDHTRGCSAMSDRYDALGNSFQVDTVAYHLSPLRYLYPDGIVVLSLFSGIGGGEVALHKLGLFLKVLVAVELNAKLRLVIASWWKKSHQKGELILKEDVKDLTYEALSTLMDKVGKIDLIIGGSPCNNLSGNNRISRVGLSGKESSLFFEFPRILNIVKQIMSERAKQY